MERKRALSMVLSQTRQQEKRDEEVLSFKEKIILYRFCLWFTFIVNEVCMATYNVLCRFLLKQKE